MMLIAAFPIMLQYSFSNWDLQPMLAPIFTILLTNIYIYIHI